MKPFAVRSTLFALGVLASVARAAEPPPQPINLAAALRLAGADNLEIRLAQERLAEAQATHREAIERFFPYLLPGVRYQTHDGNVQNVEGRILDAHKQSLTAGLSVGAQLDLGESIYRSLTTRHLVRAAEFAAESQRRDSIYQAASGYLELVRAHAAVQVALESVNIADDYAAQVRQAVSAGLGFKGDQFRTRGQAERNRLTLRQTQEQRRVAAARLAEILRLSPTIDLRPEGGEPAPMRLFDAKEALGSLVGRALSQRTELKQAEAESLAASRARAGSIYGPLIPSLRADYFYGGLGGGQPDSPDTQFGESTDFSLGLAWRIGPGGLGDFARIDAQTARLRFAQVLKERRELEIKRQVVETEARVRSYGDQLSSAREALSAAREALGLARQRQQFGVGEVLENIQAEQDLSRSRFDYLGVVTEYNRAQFALKRALGE